MSTARDVIVAGCLVGFLCAGTVKGGLEHAPIDMTLVMAALLAFATLLSWLRQDMRVPHGAVAVALLFVSFVPAITEMSGNPYGETKILHLFTLTLLAACAPLVLVRSAARVRWFAGWLLVAGLLVGLLSVMQSTPDARLSLPGSNTISTARVAATGATVLGVWAFSCIRHASGSRRLLAWIGAAAAGAVLVGTAVATGSRGPLLAMISSLVITVVFTPGTPLRRAVRVTVMAAALVGFGAWAMTNAPEASSERLLLGVTETGLEDNTRVNLGTETLQIIKFSPFGIGWGDLAERIPPSVMLDSGWRLYSHNVILETFVEAGWIAGGALVVVLMIALRRAARRLSGDTGKTVFALLVFSLLNALVSGDLNDNRQLFVVAAIAVSLPGMSGLADARQPENTGPDRSSALQQGAQA